jgi:electron transfer flavoprotein beta subunit
MYKNACSISEGQKPIAKSQKPTVTIEEWNADDINPDFSRLGMSGSPTKVKSIENVVLTSKENKIITNSESEINELMKELVTAHII